jgi:hypothetical protein
VSAYNPSAYIHEAAKKEDSEVKELLKALLAKQDAPKADPMQFFSGLMQFQAKLDSDRKIEEAKLQAERIRADAEARKEESAAKIKIAEYAASASKDQAASAVTTAEKVAKIQADAQATVMKMLEKKTDSWGELEKMSTVAERMFGMKNQPLSAAAEAGGVVRDTVPVVTQSVLDVISAWQLGKGQSGQGGGNQTNAPEGAPATEVEAQQQAGYFQVFGGMLRCLEKGIPGDEMPRNLGTLCMTTGLDDSYLSIRDTLIMATPGTLALALEGQARKLGVLEKARPQIQQAKALLTSPQGVQWLKDFKAALVLQKAQWEEEDRQEAAMVLQQQRQAAAPAPKPTPTPIQEPVVRQPPQPGKN